MWRLLIKDQRNMSSQGSNEALECNRLLSVRVRASKGRDGREEAERKERGEPQGVYRMDLFNATPCPLPRARPAIHKKSLSLSDQEFRTNGIGNATSGPTSKCWAKVTVRDELTPGGSNDELRGMLDTRGAGLAYRLTTRPARS